MDRAEGPENRKSTTGIPALPFGCSFQGAAVSETNSTVVHSEKLQSVRSDWVPLDRGPFEFRNVIKGGVVRPGTPDEVLCESIMQPHTNIGDFVRSVRLNRISGMIELTFNGTDPNCQRGVYLPHVELVGFSLVLRAAIIHSNPRQGRMFHTLLCKTWSRMEEEFYTAVSCGACIVFARRGAYDAARFTEIPADIFLAHKVNWWTGECTGPDGKELFAVHLAGSKRVAVERSPVASPSKRCRVWLEKQMLESPLKKPKSKANFLNEAQEKFGISANEFNGIWKAAIETTNANWDKAGAPKKSAT
jgi:hypothetical protein